MARDRAAGKEARQAQKLEKVQVEVDELRRQGRAWYYRGILALMAAAPLAFIVVLLTAVLVGIAIWCFVKGTGFGFRANELLAAAGGEVPGR
ncbi:hypothetical protein DSM112329_01246 [Paraconexibacter sp. AEG42_29]|uniref:Uncharacterized protein n=1 Tax=Paraconexibacter sp. AEG42_29 TaxID=2997339 RepID=A0AAU7AS22_9ACTN